MGRALQVAALSLLGGAALSGGPLFAIGDDEAVQTHTTVFVRLFHEPITSTQAGEEIPVRACLTDATEDTRVMLYYRPGRSGLYDGTEMYPSGLGCVEAVIPSEMVVRGEVEYYIVADSGTGSPPAFAGHPDDPYRIEIIGDLGLSAGGGDRTIVTHGAPVETEPSEEEPGRATPTGGYLWRVLGLVAAGLVIIAYVLLRPRLKGRITGT